MISNKIDGMIASALKKRDVDVLNVLKLIKSMRKYSKLSLYG